ncbi:MAG TPA: type II and III secretion system protein family protein [Caulobacteraceae bacterium]|jgi:pilus assembly protein CpaC|nr:type II and III secretion system protein family protein [Caulobacteraceae bacterium]
MKRLTLWLASAAASAAVAVAAAAPVPAMAGAMDMGPSTSRLVLETAKGRLIRLDAPARSVFVADPLVADVDVKSPTLVYVVAKKLGSTNLIAVDGGGQMIANIEIQSVLDEDELRAELGRVLPGDEISVTTARSSIVLTGTVLSGADAETARDLATRYAGDADHVVNHLKVAEPSQINLRVRVAEVSRDIIKNLGVNWGSSGAPGRFAFGFLSGTSNIPTPTSLGTPGAGIQLNATPGSYNLGLGYNFGPVNLDLLIDALETDGLVTVLAEPNLTALSGAPAHFLAGGEYPVPVPQSLGVTTIQYKDYGVSLAFVATVVDGGRINLNVRPEVSELSAQGSITLNGQIVPALTSRRAETTVDLGSGESFAIAGLLQNNVTQQVKKMPWLGDVPVLGALFHSDSFERNETELVIIVTPYLVHPVAGRLAAPTDGYVAATDEARLLYSDEYTRAAVAGPSPLVRSGRALVGPAGFELQ